MAKCTDKYQDEQTDGRRTDNLEDGQTDGKTGRHLENGHTDGEINKQIKKRADRWKDKQIKGERDN